LIYDINENENTYPINEENFSKRINNHSDDYKKVVLDFSIKTRHISFNEFKGTI